MLKALAVTGCLLVILLASMYTFAAFYVGRQATVDNKVHSDVIFVPGSKAFHGKGYNICLVARVKHAVSLYQSGYASRLMFSGGTDTEDKINEADTMKTIALSLGVPAQDILLERSSTSTWENFQFSTRLLQTHGLQSMIIVTEPFHSPRAVLTARKLGMTVSSSPAINSVCWLKHEYFSRYFLKEPLAIMWYGLLGRL